MKTRAELHRAVASSYEMIEDTELSINAVTKVRGELQLGDLFFKNSPDWYEFAIAIVEGKPVFKGDEIYYKGFKGIAGTTDIINYARNPLYFNDFSWNPPKQKTVMVELTFKHVENIVSCCPNTELGKACIKALEDTK